MDFNDSKDEAAFRAEAAAWLKDNVPSKDELAGLDELAAAKLWQKRKYDAGWACIRWDKEFGGRGASAIEQVIWNQEEAKYNVPAGFFVIGQGMAAPTLMTWGQAEHHARYLPKLASGEEIWCQLFSEPAGGSDLAALRTKAERDGDDWVINGQKIWTSGAFTADWMFALVRTDFDAPKHEGISFVLLPMDQEGVTVKPIRLISGSSPFCETFLDNAVAAKDDLVGDLNKGWTVGKRLLQFERSGIGGLSGGARPSEAGTSLPDIAKKYVGEAAGRISDPAIREKVTTLNMNRASFRLTAQRANAENKSGTPGAATSIFKLYGAALQQDGAELKRELMGFQGLGVQGEDFSEHELTSVEEWLHTKATTIYGGSNEIQANIIAKRVLGLPE